MLTYEEYKAELANRNTSLFGDSVDAFQAGAAESVSGMANFVGWDSAAKKLQEVAESQYETMTPESQNALAKRMINDDLSMGEGMLDGRTWLLQMAKLGGNLATTAIPGGMAGKAASLAGRVATGAKSLQAAGALAKGTSLSTNVSLNVASAGGMLGQQSEQAINDLDFEDLKDSPAFQNLVLEYGEDKELSSFDVLDRARSTLAKQANKAISHDPTMMVINGVFGTFGDRALGRVMSSGLGKTLKAQIGKAMISEGGTEAVQGGMEQYIQNVGINEQAGTQLFELTQGVAANAIESGVIGSVAGGAIGAPGHGVQKLRQRSFEKQIEQKLPQQTIDQLRASGYNDADIKSSLYEKTTNAALSHGFEADEADVMAKNYLSALFDNGPTAEQRAEAEDAQQPQEQPQPEQQQQPQQPQQQGPAGRFESTSQGALHNDANNLIKELQTRRKQALKDNDQELAGQIGQDMSRLMGGRDRIVKDITDDGGNITDPKFDEQGREAYMNTLRRTAENYFPEQLQQPSAQEQAPQQDQMFDPETGEVVEPQQSAQPESTQQNPETVQQDQTALGESLRRGDLGFVDEAAQQDAQFREGLRRAMDVSPAAVLQVAQLRKSGEMNQNQAMSALQRIINSQEITGIDQRPTDAFEQSLQDESARQRNAQRVQYERGEGGVHQPNVEESPEFQRRQAELLQGRQEQGFTTGQQGETRPNGERDVTPLATGIENQNVANAPQVEFDRWSQAQEGDQNIDQREYNSPYAQNPQTTEMEQGTVFQPRQQEREQVRYEEPAPTAQEVVNQTRGQRGGVLQGELGEQRTKGNPRQQKKAAKKMNAKRQSIYARITQSDPLDTNELEQYTTGYQPNAAMLEAFEGLDVTQDQPTVEDISNRLEQLESDGVIDAEDKQAILEQEQSEPEVEAEPTPTPEPEATQGSESTPEPDKETTQEAEVLPELKKSIEHELDVELKRMWDETPATDNLAMSRLTDIRKRFNKVTNGEGTPEDIAWAKEWTDETAKGATPPEKAEAQKPIAKAEFAEAKTGKSSNPRYQAWLDTLEQSDLDNIKDNVDYMSWVSSSSREFARINQITSKPFTKDQNKALGKYLREQADSNLSDRVAEQRGPSNKASAAKKATGETRPKTSEIANVLRTVSDPLLRDHELFSLYPDDTRKDFADSLQVIIDDLEPIIQNWKEKDPIRGKSDRALYSERNKSVFARLAKTEIDKPLQDYVWLVNKHDTTASKEVFTPLQLLSTGRLDSKMGVGTGKAAHHEALSKLLHNLRQVWDAARVLEGNAPPTPPKGTKKGGYTRTNTAPRGSEAAKPKDLKGYTKAILVQDDRPTTKEATLDVAKGLREDHDVIIAELNSMTMPNIKKMMGTYWAMTHNDYKKGQLVKAAYDGMMKQMLFSISDGAFVTTSGQSGVELGDYVIKQIEAVSSEKFNEIQQKKAEQRKAEKAESARRKEALGDPKTLQDFVAYARNKGRGIESFTPEQLKRYDELVSENKLAQLEQQRKAAAQVKAVNGDVPYQLAETMHSKLQEPRYVVQLTGERMGKEAFKELATRARQLGGNFVNAMQAKRYNTIDGFQFANVDDRNNFAKLLDGETVSRGANQQRQLEKKQDNRVTKLKEMADATEAKADKVLNQDRKTNTAKRAADAGRVMDNAYADQYSARLLRAIAEATESGDIQVLGNLSQKVQLDELDTIERQVLWNMPEAQREKFAKRDDRGNWRLNAATKLDDILFWAKYPTPQSRADRLNRLADDMENVSGYKQAAKKIRSNVKKAPENALIQMTGRDWESAVAKIRDFSRKNKNEYVAENIAEMFKREDRLNRMGIDGPAMLRYVLREKAIVERRISTDKPAETPVTKLTKKVEETIRANRNAYNDFFPTDNGTLADQVIDEADIQPGMKVLEPSAGMGHLADKIKGTGADIDVGEYANTMSELLTAKGHNVVASDFLDYNPGEIYDRVVMNPPFSNDADVIHVTHALTMLKPGGRLVAITSSMAGNRSNSTNKNFREYLDAVGAVERNNPENSFKDSLNPTSVNTKTIVIDKPDVDENLPNFDDIRFSKNAVITEPVQGMKADDVVTAAQKWKDGYAGLKAANVQVVQSQADLKDWVQTDPKATVKAVWLSQDNRVILVADNLVSPEDVRQAMRHELIGHNGVFGNLDPEQSQILTDQVMGLRKNKKLANIFAEVDASYKKAPDYVKAEEVVSRLAEHETGKLRQVADRVMAFVMGAMRRSGFLAADKATLAEVRSMINSADKSLRRNDGTLSSPDVVRFSQRVDDVPDMRQEYMAALESSRKSQLQKILAASRDFIGNSKLLDSIKDGLLGLFTLRQLVDIAESRLGSDFHTNMKTYLDEVNQMMADEGNGHQNIMNVFEPLEKWRRENPELADRTFEVMHEFTLDNVDPFQDYQDLTPELMKAKSVIQEKMKGRSGESKAQWMKEVNEIDAQIKYEPKRKKNLEQSKRTLNSLPPDAQKVIKSIRDHYSKQREDMYDAMMERAADLAMNGGLNKGQMLKIRLDNEIAKKSFYVPLTRFGDYFIDGVDENGERVFTMHQTENEMLKAKARLKASGFEVKSGKSIDSFAGLDAISTTVVKKMFDHLETTTMSEKARDAMKDNVYQMYLESLPNRSIRKQFIHRKGVKGFSKDALQALADQGAKQTKQLAKFKHEDALAKSIANLNDAYNQLKVLPEEEGENRVFAARFMNEMTKRNEWVMNPKRAAWASKLTGIGFFWMIGASPASAMINLTQNVVVAIPVIGSRYGVAATSKVMTGLTGDFFRNFKGAHVDMAKRREYGILGSTILSGDERVAMKHAIAMGVIDTTQAHDLLDLAENQPTNLTDTAAKWKQRVGWMFHHAEVLNREVTYMTAYRMAKQSGDSHQSAMEYATKATWDSHFDYGSLNRARFMQADVAAVALQFKQYSQNMTYYLFSNFSKAWMNKKIPMEERVEARKQLLGTLAATFVFGGLGALPVATLAAIANLANTVFGDEDEPWDAEVEMQEILKEWFGRDLANGIYYGMGTMVGAPNISGRVSIDPLGMWVRQSDAIGARKTFEDYTLNMMGPTYSTAYSMAGGLDYIFRDQKDWKGSEAFMPKWIRDVSKAARYMSEGGNVSNNNGDVIVADLTPVEYAGQALGFTPDRSVVQYAENRAIKGYEREAMDRRKLLLNGMWLAYRNKDQESIRNIWQKINKYNQSDWGAARPITQKTVSQSMKSRVRTQSNARKGLHFNSKYSGVIDDKFAQD